MNDCLWVLYGCDAGYSKPSRSPTKLAKILICVFGNSQFLVEYVESEESQFKSRQKDLRS